MTRATSMRPQSSLEISSWCRRALRVRRLATMSSLLVPLYSLESAFSVPREPHSLPTADGSRPWGGRVNQQSRAAHGESAGAMAAVRSSEPTRALHIHRTVTVGVGEFPRASKWWSPQSQNHPSARAIQAFIQDRLSANLSAVRLRRKTT